MMRILLAVLFALSFQKSLACSAPDVSPSQEDFETEVKSFEAADAPLLRNLSYSKLLRFQDINTRNALIEIGMKDDDAGINAAALHCKLMTSNVLSVRTLPYAEALEKMPRMSKLKKDTIDSGLAVSYAVHHRNPQAGCVSVYDAGNYPDDGCNTHRFSAKGTEISFHAGSDASGHFALEDGRLIGVWATGKDVYPAELFIN